MKFRCLGYYNQALFRALPKDEVNAIVSQCAKHDSALRETGRVLAIGSLEPTANTKSIRPRGGAPVVTDGPFAETKEQIGAFFIIDACDIHDAVRIASNHPAAHLGEAVGWGIEIQPIEQADIFK